MKNRKVHIIGVLLVLLTLIAFSRVLVNDFVNYDDEPYVLMNDQVKAGLTAGGMIWAFTSFHSGNWHPVTWLSHMLDVELYQLKPWGHHLTSLLLHAANVLLLFLVLNRMTGSVWRSAFVAGLFGLHPLRVESVAWVAERKDVLSTLFWLLTMWAYVRYVRSPGLGTYIPVVVLFALGLMAKPMVVTLPFVLLLLDYWPLNRVGAKHLHEDLPHSNTSPANALPSGKGGGTPAPTGLLTHRGSRLIPVTHYSLLVIEKAPLLALALASSIITFLAQRHSGAVLTLDRYPPGVRIANALVSYIGYIWKMLWPREPAVFYPHPGASLPVWEVICAAVLLIAMSVAALWAAKRHPYIMVGWLWYLGTLVPVIGLVQVGSQAMADRYTYLPLIGIFVIIAWGISEAISHQPSAISHRPFAHSPILPFSASVSLLALVLCTWLQVGYWKNSITLFRHAVAATSGNHVAHHNLAVALRREKKLDEVIGHYRAVLRIRPQEVGVHGELAGAYFALGRLDEALAEYMELVKAMPDNADVRCGLGELHLMQGRTEDAAREFREALRLDPTCEAARRHLDESPAPNARPSSVGVESHFKAAVELARQKRYEEAIREYRESIRLKPDYAEAHGNLGALLAVTGRTDEAIRAYREAIRLRPDDPRVHGNLAVALYTTGDYTGAWREVRLCRKYGGSPPTDFIRALSERMPAP